MRKRNGQRKAFGLLVRQMADSTQMQRRFLSNHVLFLGEEAETLETQGFDFDVENVLNWHRNFGVVGLILTAKKVYERGTPETAM